MSSLPVFIALVTGLAVVLSGCDLLGGEEGDVVAGVDLDALFAPPKVAELEAVRRDWAARGVSADGYEEVSSTAVTAGGTPLRMRVVAHDVGEVRHYGAILTPESAPSERLPVLLYLHGGDAGVNVDRDVLLVLSFVPALREGFVVVVPSYRSEPLTAGGRTYRSGGAPSPWDRDVDDVLSLLEVALETTPQADAGRVVAIGFSRGATVGLLAAARGERIVGVVALSGPTDFLGPFARAVTTSALRGDLPVLPGIDVLDQRHLQPLREGTASLEETRAALIRRSPVYFADRLPRVQLHHGTADATVPSSEAEALDAALRRLGRSEHELHLYEGGTHSPLTLSGSFQRIGRFLATVLQAPPA